MRKSLNKCIIWHLVMAMFILGITPRVYAGFSPSEIISLSPSERASDLQKTQKFLEMKVAKERFRELGISPEEIQARLDQVSDSQLHQLALKLDDLKVGADSGLGIIIFLLMVLIVVVVILQVTGHKVVVK
jgi:hypothetical protein